MSIPAELRWQLAAFQELEVHELYTILQLRSAVFVVQQNCAYQDLDGKDEAAHHLIGWAGEAIAAYLRILVPGVSYPEPSLGRVITSAHHRGAGLGRQLMQLGIGHAGRLYPGHGIRISAQRYLERFYSQLGFSAVSEPYDEDGIPHIEMLKGAA